MAEKLVMQTVNGRVGVVSFSNVSPMIEVLRSIDRGHVNALRARGREIATPVRDAIKGGIPGSAPISGMIPKVIPGRLTWNTGVVANATKIDTPYLKKKAKFNSIVRVRTLSPALSVADMAGRSGRRVAKYPYTREYDYSLSPTGKRKHRITHAGSMKFIQSLDSSSSSRQKHASRFVWPSAEKALPKARNEMLKVLQVYYDQVNARLRG